MSRSKTRRRKERKKNNSKSIVEKENKIPAAFAALVDDYVDMFGAENVNYSYDEQSQQWKVYCEGTTGILT